MSYQPKAYIEAYKGVPLLQSGFDLKTSIERSNSLERNDFTKHEVQFISTWEKDTPSPGDIISGSVEFVEEGFKEMGLVLPESLNKVMPEIDHALLGREIWTGTKKDFKPHLFVKPLLRVKAFTGKIYNQDEEFIEDTSNLAEDELLLYSSPINLISEYRCWVYDGQVVDMRRYTGKWNVLPDPRVPETAVQTFFNTDIGKGVAAYTVDVGVTTGGQTVLIEYNDIFGTATYGFDEPELYKLYAERFDQVLKAI